MQVKKVMFSSERIICLETVLFFVIKSKQWENISNGFYNAYCGGGGGRDGGKFHKPPWAFRGFGGFRVDLGGFSWVPGPKLTL